MNHPKVSVIMPSLNVAPYIRECLDSVVNQTLKEIEIICVDAGSTDGTLEVLEEYAARDQRITLIHSTRKSYGYQMNLGINAARGDYIGIVETDDYVSPKMFNILYTMAASRKYPDVVKSGYFRLIEGEEKTEVKKNFIINAKTGDTFSVSDHYEILGAHPSIWSCIYKKSFLEEHKIKFMDVPGAGWVDNPFLFQTLCEAERICWVNEPLYYYRETRPGSSTEIRVCSIPIDRVNDIKDYLERTGRTAPQLERVLYKRAIYYIGMIYNNPFLTEKNRIDAKKMLKRFNADIVSDMTADAMAKYPEYFDNNSRSVSKLSLKWFDKKIKGGVQCVRDHGAAYTVRRTLYHMGLWKGEERDQREERKPMNQPKVSVIMPSLNVAPYIRECMESVVNQTLKEIEIICVDAGSTDGTLEVLEEYASRDQRITLIHSDKKSYGYQMNLGIAAAKGEYIGIVETDDYVASNMFESLYRSAKTNNAEVVKSNYFRLKTLPYTIEKFDNYSGFQYGRIITPEKNGGILLTTPSIWTGIYKNSFLSIYNIQFLETPGASYQDTGFILKVFLSAQRLLLLNDAFVYYRKDNENSSVKSGEKANFICEEIDSVQSFISEKPEKKAMFQDYLWPRYFEIYRWNYYRLADHLRLDFAFKTKAFFEKPFKNGEINRRFFSESNWTKLNEIISSPESFYYNNRGPISIPVFEKLAAEYDISVRPKVSVIIPVYNTEKYLRECLDSIVNQTLKDIELICVNDGSVDKSLSILEEYQKTDSRITVISQANTGQSAARNCGMRYARGEYIYFIDSDDLLELNTLEKTYKIAKEKNLDIIQFERKMFFDSEKLAKNPPFHIKHITERTEVMNGVQYVKTSKDQSTYVVSVCFDLWRRTYLEEHKIVFKEGVIHEDHLFCFQAYMAADRVMRIPDRLYLRRVRESSTMTSPKSAKNVIGYFTCAMGVLEYALNHESEPLKEQEIKREYNSMLNAARRNYEVISSEEKKKVIFSSEIENELFKQLIACGDTRYELNKTRNALDSINKSVSFRVGRAITWFPRKVRGGVRCYRDHGFSHTFRRTLYHMGLWEDEANPDYNNRPLLKRFVDCYSDHGLPHTAWRVLVYLHMAKDTEEPALLKRLEAAAPAKKEPAKTVAPIKKDYSYYSSLSPEKYPEELKLWYKRVMKEDLDLDNPKTYNEKIQWMKLYDSTPLKTRLADKYLVRDWVKEKIGEEYLIPLLGVWDSFDEIDFDKLPDQFVLKANHGCGWNIIVSDKSTFNKEEARKKFNVWMHTNFAFRVGFELHYMNILPKIIAEQYLENINNDLYDYKVFCFDGKAESIMFLSDRKKKLKMSFYDLQWNKLPFVYSYPQNPDDIPKPMNLKLMTGLAEKLAEGFPHVRVDFYVLNDGSIKFGEMTFSSASGTCKWNIPEQDRIYGDLIKLPPKSPIPTRQLQ